VAELEVRMVWTSRVKEGVVETWSGIALKVVIAGRKFVEVV